MPEPVGLIRVSPTFCGESLDVIAKFISEDLDLPLVYTHLTAVAIDHFARAIQEGSIDKIQLRHRLEELNELSRGVGRRTPNAWKLTRPRRFSP
ncbi:MAG: hypothetical protein RLN76_03255 [Phycisphaeraceae bacterium]